MGNTSSRQNTYQQYHRELNAPKKNVMEDAQLKKIDMKTLNYYEVLNVSKDFTWEELKESYRKLAINVHPDKPNGNKELFNIITYSFKQLAKEYKNRTSDLDHYDLKKQSSEFFHKMTSETMTHPSDMLQNPDEAFSTKFNRNFEKCKVLDDDIDFGYGEKMHDIFTSARRYKYRKIN